MCVLYLLDVLASFNGQTLLVFILFVKRYFSQIFLTVLLLRICNSKEIESCAVFFRQVFVLFQRRIIFEQKRNVKDSKRKKRKKYNKRLFSERLLCERH